MNGRDPGFARKMDRAIKMGAIRKFAAFFAALAATIVAFAPAAFAQGCVMCYTSASAAGKRGEHALDKAILVLLIPPLLLFVGILIFAFRRSHVSSSRAAATVPPLALMPRQQTVLRLSFFSRLH